MLTATKSGIDYSLDDGVTTSLIGDDGWGMVNSRRLEEVGPLQHGSTDLGFRLLPRVGLISLKILGTSRDNLYVKRKEILDIFAPTDDSISLTWDFTTYARRIDGFPISVSFSSDNRIGFAQDAIVSIRCPDAVFYDPIAQFVDFTLGGGGDSYEIPHPVPHVVGASVLSGTTPITNNGNWRSYPHQIRVTGPITDLVITNNTTNEILDFTGTTVAGGEYYDIDLRWGFKTIVNGSGTNRIDKLVNTSDLSSWHLASTSDTTDGINSISVDGTGVTVATSVSFNFYDNYLGI